MTLASGTRLGPYEIVSALGAGGMGEVYRARDIKLNRDVAIKVLPASLMSDPERLARFTREAQVLASLNHPNIAAIYHVEDTGEAPALVMELVEGEDLSQRIARGAIPLDEALPIARQIAESLEVAHEQGIIHRDLKPANIKVRPDGTVKVLDFGLAKLAESAVAGASRPEASLSPTITSPAMMTGVGVLLGTAAYMAPEQARGKVADKRSDIWAFGCVLYEMLTGKRPFDGEDVTDVLVAVLGKEPVDLSFLPTDVPIAIRRLLRRCLEKDRRKRVADISTALFVLDEQASLSGSHAVAPMRQTPLSRRIIIPLAIALVTSTVVGAAVWFVRRPVEPVPPRVSRLPLAPSGTAALNINGNNRDLAITPDGFRIVYVGNRGTQLFVRALDALEPVAVYTGAPRSPFVSPDGQWIGFADALDLKKVAVTGGPAITLAKIEGGFRGATWAPDDTIIFATNNLAAGLQRITASGESMTVITRPDRAKGEADHLFPEMLPGGRAVLFTIAALAGGLDASQVAVLDLQTGKHTVVVRGGSHAHYVASGHLVYAAAGTLRALSFDLASLKTSGTAVPVIPQVDTSPFGEVDAVVAGNGTLAYVAGGGLATTLRTLVWVDRQGRETPIPAPPRVYMYPRLSPDGTRIAVYASDQEQDLWLWDLMRLTLTRLTFEKGTDYIPMWTPDGRRLLFTSDRGGAQNLFVQAADGTGSPTRLTESANQQGASAITADGTRVVFYEQTPARGRDLRLLTLAPTPHAEPLLETPFDERGGVVSPDGRWLAYESNSSGRFEIYVRPFPNVADGQWQVSTAGGVQPLWAHSGRELFYLAPDGVLLAVPDEPRGTTWSAGTATKVVDGRYYTGGGGAFTSRHYDVSPDGQRFLMVKEGNSSGQTATSPQLIVVQNWSEELKRLVPTK
jgi:serine/threonine-protein kinase